MYNSWKELYDECIHCTKCPLHETRTNVVFGEGDPHAKILIIGEGPGADEDASGRPFVGRAGKLLTTALEAVGLSRDKVFIANIVKCRPPQNRVPTLQESETCKNYLRNQFAFIKPKIVVCLGATAMKNIMDENAQISKIRGNWIDKKGTLFIATFHPAALLRDGSKKLPFWEDLKAIKEKADELT